MNASDDNVTAAFQFRIEGIEQELRVVRFEGEEELSRPYEFRISVATRNPSMRFGDVARKSAALTIRGEQGPRVVHGLVMEFERSEVLSRYTVYTVTLAPRLTSLAMRQDCRVFQNLSTPEVAARVLEDAGMNTQQFRLELSGQYKPKPYCVQYRETDLAFIARILAQEGIYYFFEHSEDEHTLVLTDHAGAHSTITEGDPDRGLELARDNGGVAGESIQTLKLRERVCPGKTSLRDFDFLRPEMSMDVSADALEDVDLEIFDYPGGYEDPGAGLPGLGGFLGLVRLDALQSNKRRSLGRSTCHRMIPGSSFKLADEASSGTQGEQLITSLTHRGEQPQSIDIDRGGDCSYNNEFECQPRDQTFRPPKAPPNSVRGPQTATVVGPEGQEIYCDEHGRIKVQFHWDREGKRDERSSCWVRVAQPWAGGGYGALFIPRIGQEVLVVFLEGDPDQPVVAGCLYNGMNSSPRALPNEQACTTIRTRSTPDGDGFNELRFDDRKGAEEVYMHAHRDMNVVVVEGDQSNTVKKGAHHHRSEQETLIESRASHVEIRAKTRIRLVVGASSLTMNSDGTITLTGRDIRISSGGGTLTLDASGAVATRGEQIASVASGQHTIVGAVVDINP